MIWDGTSPLRPEHKAEWLGFMAGEIINKRRYRRNPAMSDTATETNSMPDRVRLDPDYHGWTDQVVGWADGNEAQDMAEWPLYVRADLTTPDTRDALIKELVGALRNSSATIVAVYQWLEMVEKEGGATSISGVAKCHAMLTSLRKNADRTEKLIMTPARAALTCAKEAGYGVTIDAPNVTT